MKWILRFCNSSSVRAFLQSLTGFGFPFLFFFNYFQFCCHFCWCLLYPSSLFFKGWVKILSYISTYWSATKQAFFSLVLVQWLVLSQLLHPCCLLRYVLHISVHVKRTQDSLLTLCTTHQEPLCWKILPPLIDENGKSDLGPLQDPLVLFLMQQIPHGAAHFKNKYWV